MPNHDDHLRPWQHLKRWSRLVFSFKAAGTGIKDAFRTQQNFRLDLLAVVVVAVLAIMLSVSHIEAAILTLCVGAVLCAEVFNTALEKLVDLACPQIDERARYIKDVSAAAVLVMVLASMIVGLLIFGPKVWALLHQFLPQ